MAYGETCVISHPSAPPPPPPQPPLLSPPSPSPPSPSTSPSSLPLHTHHHPPAHFPGETQLLRYVGGMGEEKLFDRVPRRDGRPVLQRPPRFGVVAGERRATTARRGRAHPVGQCCDLWHQYWDAVEHQSAVDLRARSLVREQSLWSGHQPLWMFVATSLPTDWRPREPKRTSTPSGPLRKLQESGA